MSSAPIIIHGDTELRSRKLPHLEREDASYFVTWRLAGTLPLSVLAAIHAKAEVQQSVSVAAGPNATSNDQRKREFARLDCYLDTTKEGDCWLANSVCSNILRDVILEQGERATIDCFTVMPNHVHLLFRPHAPDTLRSVMKRIKQISAYRCLQVTNSKPPFWQEENWDYIPREGEWPRIVSYIIRNPVSAGLCKRWKDWAGTYLADEFPGIDERGFLMG